MKAKLAPGRYVVAVSGGVDSMVLLDLLSKKNKLELIVAHFDHGIRTDSVKDKQLVENVAHAHGLEFVTEKGELGADASEATARTARYSFLKRVMKEYDANAIVVAHHRDDALETLIINSLRGTGRRGVLKETKTIKRPLLSTTKDEIIEYAKTNHLVWREDSTNNDTKYLRNYVRHELIPKMKRIDPESTDYLLSSHTNLSEANYEIENELDIIVEDYIASRENGFEIPRQWLIMLPNEVGREVLYDCTRRLKNDISLDRKNIESALVFSKTAKPGKTMELNKYIHIRTEPAKIIVELV